MPTLKGVILIMKKGDNLFYFIFFSILVMKECVGRSFADVALLTDCRTTVSQTGKYDFQLMNGALLLVAGRHSFYLFFCFN
jgi:hypothetical protein